MTCCIKLAKPDVPLSPLQHHQPFTAPHSSHRQPAVPHSPTSPTHHFDIPSQHQQHLLTVLHTSHPTSSLLTATSSPSHPYLSLPHSPSAPYIPLWLTSSPSRPQEPHHNPTAPRKGSHSRGGCSPSAPPRRASLTWGSSLFIVGCLGSSHSCPSFNSLFISLFVYICWGE